MTIDWFSKKLTTIGLFLGFAILKQYSAFCMFLQNFAYQQYYYHKSFKKWTDYGFGLYHHIRFDWLGHHIEPQYNPWASIYYMCSNIPQENYYNLNHTNEFFGYYPFPNTLDTTSHSYDENERVFGVLNSIYYAFNFIKTAKFDVCYDYLVLMKYRGVYISRVGIYNGMKNLRKEDFSMEKTIKSVLVAEYTHPKMSGSIMLPLDTGYFITNNEILSPMFVKRALTYQSAPYVFDYGYKIRIMDSNIKYHVLDSTNFVLLKKTGCEIMKL